MDSNPAHAHFIRYVVFIEGHYVLFSSASSYTRAWEVMNLHVRYLSIVEYRFYESVRWNPR